MLINKLNEGSTNRRKHICNSHKPRLKPKFAKELPPHRPKKEYHFFLQHLKNKKRNSQPTLNDTTT